MKDWLKELCPEISEWQADMIIICRNVAVAAALERERKELEVELLKLMNKAGSVRDYVQGRWDVIGEFQDVLRARGE